MQTVLNYHKLLSTKTADFVCSEPPTIETENDTDKLVKLLEHDNWMRKLYEAIIDVSRYGNAVMKFVDKSLSTVAPQFWFPIVDECDLKRIKQHVIAYPVCPDEKGVFTQLYVEIHDIGRVYIRRYRLNKGRTLGKELQEKYRASGVDKARESGIIKNITVNDINSAIKMSKTQIEKPILDVLSSVILKSQRDEKVFIDNILFVNIPPTNAEKPLMQVYPVTIDNRTFYNIKVNKSVVQNTTLEELNNRIAQTSVNIAQSFEEAIIHEIGHLKLINGKSSAEIEVLYNTLSNKGTSGISMIAMEDGAECIAEVEVLLHRGSPVPQKALNLYNTYVKGDFYDRG